MTKTQPISKDSLAQKYGISKTTLRKLMNVIYLNDLKTVGYDVNMILLPPNVVRKFIEVYGEPITDEI